MNAIIFIHILLMAFKKNGVVTWSFKIQLYVMPSDILGKESIEDHYT